MLVNFTNHPYACWSKKQKEAAQQYGTVIDLPFPKIDPSWGVEKLIHLSDEYKNTIVSLAKGTKVTVHVMGEMSFTVLMVSLFIKSGIQCIASTSERYSEMIEVDTKQVKFRFVRFREYIL